MKEITDCFQQEFDRELQEVLGDGVKSAVNGHDVIIPRKILLEYERKTRFYEVEDVEDIRQNYATLSRTSYIPLRLWFFILRNFFAFSGYENFRDSWKNLDEFLASSYYDLVLPLNSRISLKYNFNMALIDNVYLRNFSFIKKGKFEACEFDIIDKQGNHIRGIFPYREDDSFLDDLNIHQLENIVGSSEAKTFDLQFIALPEHYKFKKEGGMFGHKYKYYAPRGKKLLVEDIHEARGEIDSEETPRITLGRSLIHQLI